MPFLHLQLSAVPSPSLTAQLTETLTELTTRVLRKEAAHTALVIDYVDPARWAIGGRSLAEQQAVSFFLIIRITAGTNTKNEKAAYQAQVFARLSELLGEVHPISYSCVQEVGAEAYGYGEYTQEHRYIAGKLAAATPA